MTYSVPKVPISRFRSVCRTCQCSRRCIPAALHDDDELDQFETLIQAPKPLKPKKALFHQGAASDCIYIVHSGCIKTVLTDADVNSTADCRLLSSRGIDRSCAPDDHRHDCTAIATVASQICNMPKTFFEIQSCGLPALRSRLMGLISDEITRNHEMMMLLGRHPADQRIAIFLLNIHQRLTCLRPQPVWEAYRSIVEIWPIILAFPLKPAVA